MNDELDAALIDSCLSLEEILEIVEEECRQAWSNNEEWRWQELAFERDLLRSAIGGYGIRAVEIFE